jgi:DNA-directed RNA polymerase subunit F
VDELTTDHREALELLERIASSVDPDERRELADMVITEVVRHSVAEEQLAPLSPNPSHRRRAVAARGGSVGRLCLLLIP